MQKDKAKHFVVGGLLAAIPLAFGFGYEVAILLAGIAGAFKEAWDVYTPGHEDFMDFFWTLVGGLVACGIWWFLT